MRTGIKLLVDVLRWGCNEQSGVMGTRMQLHGTWTVNTLKYGSIRKEG